VDAAACGHLDIVDYLVRSGGSVTLPTCNEVTPLEAAVTNGHCRIAEYLLAHGAAVDATMFAVVIARGDLPLFKALVKAARIDPGNYPQARAWMQQAINAISVEIVEYLLDRGVSVIGCSLEPCIRSRGRRLAELLVRRCPCVKHRTDGLELLTITALRNYEYETAQWLSENGVVLDRLSVRENSQVVRSCILTHAWESVKMLLASDPDLTGRMDLARHWIDALNGRGWTDEINVLDITQKLIDCGVTTVDPAGIDYEEAEPLRKEMLVAAARRQKRLVQNARAHDSAGAV
jgi:hypothetical protein